MIDEVFLDTNVLVYAADASEPRKQAQARAVMGKLVSAGRIWISTQVLQELYSALRRGPRPITTPEQAEAAVAAASAYPVVQVTVPLIREAIVRSQLHQISFWDALIIGAAKSAGCVRILSEDLNVGQVIDGVRVENPFAQA